MRTARRSGEDEGAADRGQAHEQRQRAHRRAQDPPMYLFEVKKPEESKGPWDYYKQLATIPAEEAWRPLDQGECPLVRK